ncbi:MAG: dihydroorotase [Owenweeksia sp.]|nr:dihydroorotase [Owenweeksia sp.]
MESSKILIKQARVIDPQSEHHQQKIDILLENDQVQKVAPTIEDEAARQISHKNLHISPGWFDLRVNFNDPGREEREDLETGIRAAIAGGFTGVGLSPQTEPPLDSKADIEYIYQRSEGYPLNVFPYGSISKAMAGQELSEMYDMHQSGAVGFSHGKVALTNAALVKLALQYAREFAPPLHLMPLDESLARHGQMHEGQVSTYLGLRGIPTLAEEIGLLRDLHLAGYAETGVHLTGISSAGAVNLLKEAHRLGTPFTADVALPNLIFTDEMLESYDTNYKLLPPLRSEDDRKMLLQAIQEEIIQVVTSDHSPVDIENKKCEFDQADYGSIGLQTLFGALGNLRDELGLEQIVKLISINPRKILNLPVPIVSEGSWAEFTLFDPDLEWTFSRGMVESKSYNSPFLEKQLRGQALGIINNGILVWMGDKT